MRIRRSIGWAKGFSVESVQKIIDSVCDAVCIDLEDGVPAGKKEFARELTAKMLKEMNFHGSEKIVRVNPFGSEDFKRDIMQVLSVIAPDAIRLPKCESVVDMLEINSLLAEIEKNQNLLLNSIEVIAMIESPAGIRNAFDIASCCKRVTALNVGMEDLTREMGVERRYSDNELDLIYARQKVVLDAKAAGVQIIDSCLLICNQESNFKQNAESRQMGFDGRSVHDNAEAENANKIFCPSEELIAFSRGAVEAYKRDTLTGAENVVYEGKRICFAAYEKALDVLNLDKLIKEHEKRRK